MINTLKNIMFKILILSMIFINLSFFTIRPVAEAKIVLKEGEFFYSGTQSGELVIKAGIWETILKALSQFADYLMGLMTLGIRGVIVGWTEVFEILLTSTLNLGDDVETINDDAKYSYDQKVVTIESILFNRVRVLNANIFDNETSDDTPVTPVPPEEEERQTKAQAVMEILRTYTAKWYYIFRLISIAIMLLLLILIGSKLAFSTLAEEKALYKQALTSWFAGMILVFSIHYIMVAILSFNEDLVKIMEDIAKRGNIEILEEYEYGEEKNIKTTEEVEQTLYEEVRTRAYSLKMSDGFTGLILYAVLVYYAWKFAIIYFKRMLNTVFLTIMAPVVAVYYSVNKCLTGKGNSKVFSIWLTEYIINVVSQLIHAMLYVTFGLTALQLTLATLPGVVLAIMLFKYMLEAADILKQLFKLSGEGGTGLIKAMTENSSPQDLYRQLKRTTDTFMHAKVAKSFVKGTYKIAFKPVTKGAELVIGRTMEKIANGEQGVFIDYAKKKEKIDAERIERQNKGLRKYEEFTGANARKERIAELQAENEKLLKEMETSSEEEIEQDEKIKQTSQSGEKSGSASERKKRAEKNKEKHQKLVENTTELEKLLDEEQYYQDHLEEYQDAFLQSQLNGETTFKDARQEISENISSIFDYRKYVKLGKDGKYHVVKRKEKVFDGWYNKIVPYPAKVTDSVGMRLRNNLKIQKILGLSDAQKKALQEDAKFYKNTILGVAGGIVGIPMLGINPLLGIGLLGNAAVNNLNIATKVRKYNTIKRVNGKYKFKEFSNDAKMSISQQVNQEIINAEDIIDERTAKHHKKLMKRMKSEEYVAHPIKIGASTFSGIILGVPGLAKSETKKVTLRNGKTRFVRNTVFENALFADSKYAQIHQKEVKKKLKDAKKEIITENIEYYKSKYQDEFKKYMQTIAGEDSEDSVEDVALKNDDKYVVSGNKVFEFGQDEEMAETASGIQKILQDEKKSRELRIREAKIYISKNSDKIIQGSVVKVCAKQGIIDITNLELTEKNIEMVKKDFIDNLEKKGLLKKDEISPKDVKITNESIRKEIEMLKSKSQTINTRICNEFAVQTCKEFLQNGGSETSIQRSKDLKSPESVELIVEAMKGKTKSEATKKSEAVVGMLNGQRNRQHLSGARSIGPVTEDTDIPTQTTSTPLPGTTQNIGRTSTPRSRGIVGGSNFGTGTGMGTGSSRAGSIIRDRAMDDQTGTDEEDINVTFSKAVEKALSQVIVSRKEQKNLSNIHGGTRGIVYEKQKVRRENRVKEKLERSVMTGDDSELTDQEKVLQQILFKICAQNQAYVNTQNKTILTTDEIQEKFDEYGIDDEERDELLEEVFGSTQSVIKLIQETEY